jgi:hypothetical protein
MTVRPSREFGNWAYAAGSAGTVIVPAFHRVIGIAAHAATGGAGGSVQIDGGDVCPVPAGVGIEIWPKGNLFAPTIVFTGTDSFFVEHVGNSTVP